MKRIAVTLEGGLVQSVLAEEPVEVIVVDYDVEGASEDEIIEIFDDEQAVLRKFEAEINPAYIDAVFKKKNKKQ